MLKFCRKKKCWIPLLIVLFLLIGLWIRQVFFTQQVVVFNYHPSVNVDAIPLKPFNTHTKKIRILVLEGGGAEGIIPLHVLTYMEKASGKPISQLFDIIAATSTGAIIAAALTRPAEPGSNKPYYSAQQVLNFYNANIPYIFSTSFSYKVFTLWGILGPKYNPEHLRKVLEDHSTKDQTLRDLILPVVIPCYSLDENQPFVFQSHDLDHNYYVTDVLQGVTAAPSIFPPVKIYSTDHKVNHIIVDGSMFANNPAFTGLVHAMQLAPQQQYIIVELGTGNQAYNFKYNKVRTWGVVGWFRTFITLFIQADQSYINREVKLLTKIYPDRLGYYRIDYTSNNTLTPFTNDPNVIQEYNKFGDLTVQKNKALLDRLIKRLTYQ